MFNKKDRLQAEQELQQKEYKINKMLSNINILDKEILEIIYKKIPRGFIEGQKRNSWNYYIVASIPTQTACTNCKQLSKEVYIDDIFSNGINDGKHRLLSEAIKQGLFLDSCHTTLVTYFEGMNSPLK